MCCSDVTGCAKYLLVLANFFFTLGGIAVFCLGIILIINIGDILALIHFNIEFIVIFSIVFGFVVIILSVWGCFSAIKESRWQLVTYSISMLVLAPITFGVPIMMFIRQNEVHHWVASILNIAFLDPYLAGPFLVMEVHFRCCGTFGPGSYINLNQNLPLTCCAQLFENICHPWAAFGGCNGVVTDYLEPLLIVIRNVLTAMAILQVVAVIISFFLVYFITRKARGVSNYPRVGR